MVGAWPSCAGLIRFHAFPTAYAAGCVLSPLRGLLYPKSVALRIAEFLTQAHRPSHDSYKAFGENADYDGGERSYAQSDLHGNADGKPGFVERFAHEHGIGDAHVIVEAEDRVQHGEGCKHVVS